MGRIIHILIFSGLILSAGSLYSQRDTSLRTPVYLISNFHPASCGWLTDFSTERIYCANSYFEHMDRVNEDPAYNFVISEVNNMIAMKNFLPDRFDELKKHIAGGRIEAVNGFFLELSPNLSGGEAVVRSGINGLKWQEEVLGVRPRFGWLIDVTGMNEQMAQIGKNLGFEAQVYCRNNISGHLLHWAESPDGSRLLTISGGHYAGHWGDIGSTGKALSTENLSEKAIRVRQGIIDHNARNVPISVPDWSPYLVLHGARDYSLPPLYQDYPSELIAKWKQLYPNSELRFTTLGDYYDVIAKDIASGHVDIPVVKGGWPYNYTAFWVEGPKVKQRFRKCEHLLMATEMLSTFASMRQGSIYPSRDLYQAWLLLHLNTDRNTIWGAASGKVFTDEESWNANDRFDWIESTSVKTLRKTLSNGEGKYLNMFNPVNWDRNDPQLISLPEGRTLRNHRTQRISNGILFQPEIPSTAVRSATTRGGSPGEAERIPFIRGTYRNEFYEINIDPETGEILKLALLPGAKTIIEGRSNFIIAEQGANYENLYSHIPGRESRIETASTRGNKAEILVDSGDIATLIHIRTKLYREGDTHKTITLYHNHPRIDFDLRIDSIADRTLISEEFVPAGKVYRMRRGIPYGFASGTWPIPTYADFSHMEGVVPAIRWSDYQLEDGSGFAILDRGVTGREHHGNNPRLLLTATSEIYYGHKSEYLGGTGENHFQYALIAYDKEEDRQNIPRIAWEYNVPLFMEFSGSSMNQPSFFTSSSNIILHSVRRENKELELRFAECTGENTRVEFELAIPAAVFRKTNFLGEGDRIITGDGGFTLPIRPQEIVTLRLETETPVDSVPALTDWTPLVPEHKRDRLNRYIEGVSGHPPRGEYE